MAAPPVLPPELHHDMVAEILLRLPPDEPVHLFRAALVCKPWLRIISDPYFRRRYRTFHGAPPLLGLLQNLVAREAAPPTPPASDPSLLDRLRQLVKGDPPARAASTPKFPDPFPGRWGITFLDSRNGRVLVRVQSRVLGESPDYVVWDPVTGDRLELPKPPTTDWLNYSATVLCASDGCDHTDCRQSHFRVVLAATNWVDNILVRSYSSETGAWTMPKTILVTHVHCLMRGGTPYLSPLRAAVVQDAIYFAVMRGNAIVKYDFREDRLSSISPPPTDIFRFALVPMEGDELGFAFVQCCCLHVMSRKVDTEASQVWVQEMAIDLAKEAPAPSPDDEPFVVGFAEGSGLVFVTTRAALYTVNLSSRQVKKFDEPGFFAGVLPFMSYFMPGENWTNIIAVHEEAPEPVAEAPEEEKAQIPLDLLPPSKMVLDDWKRLYSNTNSNFHEVAVKGFWGMYDPVGYSLWFCDYKNQEENTVSYVTLNKVGEFLQRMDKCRKYAFGKMLVIGSKAPFKVKGLWLFRGQEIPMFLMDESYHMELYEWTKVDISDEAQKERVNAMIEDLEPFEGQTLQDAKCFK